MQCQSPTIIGSEVNRFILSCGLMVEPLPEISQEDDTGDYDEQAIKQGSRLIPTLSFQPDSYASIERVDAIGLT